MVAIENENIRALINPGGAELSSLYHKKTGLEYLWKGDPAYWGKYSPVLFPFVGTLKQNQYYYNGKAYSCGRHGFARDKVFELEQAAGSTASFLLKEDVRSMQVYPFRFEFRIHYILKGNTLSVEYQVKNPSAETIYFSVGGHPAFALPLDSGTSYNDYYFEWEQAETAGRWPISPEGLIEAAPLPLLDNSKILPITRELFSKDALVFKELRSQKITLRSDKTARGLEFGFTGFPYLGLWAARGADFVCIEPWCGIADSVNSSQQLIGKEGIQTLEAGGSFQRSWTVTPF